MNEECHRCLRMCCVTIALRVFLSMLAVGTINRRVWSADSAIAPTPASDSNDGVSALLADLKPISLEQSAVQKLGDKDRFRVYDGNPVLSPGKFGEWDAGAIGSVTIAIVDGVYHIYYEAWGLSDPNAKGLDYTSLQIGHAVSLDGIHWKKDPANPVIAKGSGEEWDAKGTWDPYILHENGVFKLWYGGGFDRSCDWGYAESKDGSHFTKHGQISHLGEVEDDHLVHQATGEPYYMYYWDRKHEPHQGLFRAQSKDETHFDFASPTQVEIANEDPDTMYKFTHVFVDHGTWYMLYANFVRPTCDNSSTSLARSDDGIHWTPINKNLFAGHDADIMNVDDTLHLAYFGPRGFFDQPKSDVRLAIYSGRIENLIKPGD